MSPRVIITRIRRGFGVLFVFIISIPLALLASAISVFSGNSRLRHQNSIRALLKIVLSSVRIKTNNEDVLLRTAAPFILAANHVNYYDWMALYSTLNMDICVVTDSFFTRFPFSVLTKKAGFLSIGKKPSFSQSKEIMAIVNAIAKKDPVLIFVNSRPGIDQLLKNIRPGAAYLSIKTAAPVIPVNIKEQDKNEHLVITFGTPVFPDTTDISESAAFMKKIGTTILSLG